MVRRAGPAKAAAGGLVVALRCHVPCAWRAAAHGAEGRSTVSARATDSNRSRRGRGRRGPAAAATIATSPWRTSFRIVLEVATVISHVGNSARSSVSSSADVIDDAILQQRQRQATEQQGAPDSTGTRKLIAFYFFFLLNVKH